MAHVLVSAKEAAQLLEPCFQSLPSNATALSLEYLDPAGSKRLPGSRPSDEPRVTEDRESVPDQVGEEEDEAIDDLGVGVFQQPRRVQPAAELGPSSAVALDLPLLASGGEEGDDAQGAFETAVCLAKQMLADEQELLREMAHGPATTTAAPPTTAVDHHPAHKSRNGGEGDRAAAASPDEPTEDAAPTTPVDAGPRLEAAEGVIVQGYVRMFHGTKRFGFLQAEAGGEDIFVAADDVQITVPGAEEQSAEAAPTRGRKSTSEPPSRRAWKSLYPGEPVTFELRENAPRSQRRLRAALVAGPDRGPTYCQSPVHRRVGVVRYYANDKQYGFLTPAATDAALGDVFFHRTNVLWDPSTEETDREIDVGMQLEYALLEPDGSCTFGAHRSFPKPVAGSGGRRIGVCITAEGLRPLDPLTCARDSAVEKPEQREERSARQQQRKARRERDAAPALVSGLELLDSAMATW